MLAGKQNLAIARRSSAGHPEGTMLLGQQVACPTDKENSKAKSSKQARLFVVGCFNLI